MNRWWVGALMPILGLLLGPPSPAAENDAAKTSATADSGSSQSAASGTPLLNEPVVVVMDEVPAFSKAGDASTRLSRFPRGQYAPCQKTPSREVKAYPKLNSKHPLYGSVTFDVNYYDPKPGITRYFVLDESPEAIKKAEADEKIAAESAKKTGKTKGKKSPLTEQAILLAQGDGRVSITWGQPPKCTYDLLYFDLDGDCDLTNDGVVKAADKPAFADSPVRYSSNTRIFNDVAISFDLGPPLGKRPFVVVPQVHVYQGGGPYQPSSSYVQFLPKTARQGKVRLGEKDYFVRLTQSTTISGSYDRPFVQLEVAPTDSAVKETPPLKSGTLGQMQVIQGHYVTVSATPSGDKLTVAPYHGDFGTLEIGPGGRPITQLGLVAELIGRTTSVPLGGPTYAAPESLPRSYRVPVGDYMLPLITARYGRLRFSARMTPSPSAPLLTAKPNYPIAIRKDKPYVLEFSGKAGVSFASPKPTQSFKPGDNVDIKAMLNEPWQGIQITGLWDATQKKGVAKYYLDGQQVTIPEYQKLDPMIVIRDSAGKEVASGKMPFG